MNDRSTRMDQALRSALVEEPRPGLALEIAESLREHIRAVPQERPLFVLRGHGLFGSLSLARVRLVRLALVAGLVLATVMALLAFGSRPALPDNGLVVFGSDRAGLVVADPRTGESRQLVPPWEANPTGRTNRADLIAVSPSGDRLAYIVASLDGWSIPVVALPSGAAVGEVVDDGLGMLPEWDLHWSNDGTRLFLEATVDGVARIVGAELATGALFDVGSREAASRDVAPSRADGRVAFVQTSSTFDDDYRLVIWDPASRAISVLASATANGATAAAPTWAPDGRSLAVTLERADGTAAIARIGADGSGFALVTPWMDRWPSAQWSPDGTRLLVVVAPQGGREADIYTNDSQVAELFIAETDGSEPRTIVDRACTNALWSPDGASIVYEARTCDGGGGPAEVRVISSDGTWDRALWTGDPRATSRLSIAWQPIP